MPDAVPLTALVEDHHSLATRASLPPRETGSQACGAALRRRRSSDSEAKRCVLPRDAVRNELRYQHLVELKIRGLPIQRHWYVVMHKGKRLSLAAEEFKKLLIGEAVALLDV